MARYSVTHALKAFAELLERARAGEDVVITRRGVAIARIAPVKPKAETPLVLDWLTAKRAAQDEG